MWTKTIPSVNVPHSLQAIWNGAVFLICYVQLWQTKPISKLFEASSPALCKTWKLLVPCVQEKALHLTAFSQFTIDHELAPPLPAFSVGDVSGKVWSTLITTQQAEIYPQKLTWYRYLPRHVSSPKPIYWCFALCVYSLCTNILALRIQSVKKIRTWITGLTVALEGSGSLVKPH